MGRAANGSEFAFHELISEVSALMAGKVWCVFTRMRVTSLSIV